MSTVASGGISLAVGPDLLGRDGEKTGSGLDSPSNNYLLNCV